LGHLRVHTSAKLARVGRIDVGSTAAANLRRSGGPRRATIGGTDQLDKIIHLVDDRREYSAEIEIGLAPK
jgi:hypothetical protein